MGKDKLLLKDVICEIEKISPLLLQEDWDNSGLMIGRMNSCIRNIMTCLEINDEILVEAIENDIDLILTHHPLIFGEIKHITSDSYDGNILLSLIENGISVYSLHTPYDKMKNGNNDDFAKILNLVSIKNLNGGKIETSEKMIKINDEANIGRIGEVKEKITLYELIQLISNNFDIPMSEIKAVGDMKQPIKKIGLCTGAGAEYMTNAKEVGCDVFISGDLKYHEAMDAKKLGIAFVDPGHYGMEKAFAKSMAIKLEKKLGDKVNIFTSSIDINPFSK